MNVSGCLEGCMGNQNSISLQPNLPEKWCMSGGYFNRGKTESVFQVTININGGSHYPCVRGQISEIRTRFTAI